MRFSTRTPARFTTNRLAVAAKQVRRSGAELLDLTITNPTNAGLDYPVAAIRAALDDARLVDYRPTARGDLEARRAIASYYALRNVEVDPESILLTASTSEAYTWLFKLLCEPGERVLIPAPSYPLFEHLASAEAVTTSVYQLDASAGWRFDAHALLDAVTPDARAAIAVSPNNPTGSALTIAEAESLVCACGEADLAIVCDEVFADYVFSARGDLASSLAGERRALTFTLNGLSKIAGLPQLKAGWIVVGGPEAARAEAIERLEFIADLFLSVATPVQLALPRLLELAPLVRDQIFERVASNRAWLSSRLGVESAISLLPADGGWCATLQTPRVLDDEALALELVERYATLVHPGYFFDYEREGLLVVSLLVEPGRFREGCERIVACVDAICARS